MRRIDLRGAAAAAVDLGSAVPRAAFDVEAAVHVVRPICDDVRARGVEAIVEYSARFDGVEQTDIAVPPAALQDALAGLDPAVRAGLEESIRRLRQTCEAELEHDVVTDLGRRRPRDPPQGAGPARRALRARRHRAAGVLGGDERGARAGRRRAVDRAHLLAAEGPRRAPAPDDPGRLRAARHRRGVRRRWRPGRRDVRLRRRPVPQGRPGHRTGRDLHGGRQAAAQGRRRHRLRGRPDRDRRSWPTTPPTRPSWPPT